MSVEDTSTEGQYELIFEGRLVPGRVASEVESVFAKKFGESVAKRIFSASQITLKRNLDKGAAAKLQRQFHSLGLTTRISRVAAQEMEFSLVQDAPKPDKQSATESPRKIVAEEGVVDSRPQPVKTKEQQNKTISPAEIDASYSADPGQPEGVSTGYRIHLGIIAALMILLPVIYILFAVATAYGTYWHATNNLDVIDGYLGALLYVVPVFGGGLLALFFLKPFIAGSSVREPQPVRLDPAKEPAIFHLVERITDSLNAPMPEEILVNADVNASASLRNGVFSNKLTLTIGMPLLYGLSIEQLSGILAHEFGHFAQAYGMRFAALIHYINYWFYHQAYCEDGWDDMIDSWGESDIAIASLSAIFAQLGALLVRILLIVLAYIATMLSSGLSRHMEFDADRYQVELTGSDAYPDLAHQMRLLSAGQEAAAGLAAQGLEDGRLPDNIPGLSVEIAASFDQQTRNAIASDIQQINNSVFDTHPPDIERIAAADKLDKPGVFRNAAPAHKLVREEQRLGMHVTLQWYRAHGLDIEPKDLMPNATFKQSLSS